MIFEILFEPFALAKPSVKWALEKQVLLATGGTSFRQVCCLVQAGYEQYSIQNAVKLEKHVRLPLNAYLFCIAAGREHNSWFDNRVVWYWDRHDASGCSTVHRKDAFVSYPAVTFIVKVS